MNKAQFLHIITSLWKLCGVHTHSLFFFQVRYPCCVDRITSIGKMQSNTTFNIYIAMRLFYIVCPIFQHNSRNIPATYRDQILHI